MVTAVLAAPGVAREFRVGPDVGGELDARDGYSRCWARNGDLVTQEGMMQQWWWHSVPPDERPGTGARLSITCRWFR